MKKEQRPLTDEQRRLVEDNVRLVTYALKKYGWEYLGEWDDMWQIGALGLMRAARLYNPDKGSFATIALLAIRHNLWMAGTKKRAGCRIPDALLQSLDEVVSKDGSLTLADVVPSEMDIEERSLSADYAKTMLRERMWERLSQQERAILGLNLAGYKQVQIAKKLGTTQGSISRRLKRIADKCRQEAEV